METRAIFLPLRFCFNSDELEAEYWSAKMILTSRFPVAFSTSLTKSFAICPLLALLYSIRMCMYFFGARYPPKSLTVSVDMISKGRVGGPSFDSFPIILVVRVSFLMLSQFLQNSSGMVTII